MTDRAGFYTGKGCLQLTSILCEGNITVQTAVQVAGGEIAQTAVTFDTKISKGDYVGLHVNPANTYSATGGLPVVSTASASNGIIGIVMDDPEWAGALPTSNQNVWTTMLSNGYYRKATVLFFGVVHSHTANSDGSGTAIEVGAPLKWDLSEDAWVDSGTTDTGAFSFHYNNADNTTILVGFTGITTAISGNDDCTGIETIA